MIYTKIVQRKSGYFFKIMHIIDLSMAFLNKRGALSMKNFIIDIEPYAPIKF